MAPMWLFRRDHLQQMGPGAGRKADKESWAETKRLFSLLPDERRQHYEQWSQALKAQHEAEKHEATLQRRSQTAQQPTLETAKVSGLGTSAVLPANLLPSQFSSLKHTMHSTDELVSCVQSTCASLTKGKQTAPYPLDETNIVSCLLATKAKGHTLDAACKQFAARAQTISSDPPGSEPCPDEIPRPGFCGQVCQQNIGTAHFRMHSALCSHLAALEGAATSAMQASMNDVLLAIRTDFDYYPSIFHYVFLTAVSYSGGFHTADACYVGLQQVGEAQLPRGWPVPDAQPLRRVPCLLLLAANTI